MDGKYFSKTGIMQLIRTKSFTIAINSKGNHDEQLKFQLPLDYFKDGAEYDPIPLLKSYTKPKLLIDATEDEWGPIDNVRNIFEMIPEPKTFYELKGKHDYCRNAEAIKEVELVLKEFITKFIN